MWVEALCSYRLVDAKVTDLEIPWGKPPEPKSGVPTFDPQSYMQLVFGSLEDPAARLDVPGTPNTSRTCALMYSSCGLKLVCMWRLVSYGAFIGVQNLATALVEIV